MFLSYILYNNLFCVQNSMIKNENDDNIQHVDIDTEHHLLNSINTNTSDKIIVKFKGDNYDITKYAKKHPGGKQILIDNIGNDIESLMNDIGHSDQAYKLLEKYKITEY